MATDTLQNVSDQWEPAFARFQEIAAAFDEAIERHAAAENAAGDECPREARFFDQYGLGMGMDRKRVISNLRWYSDRTGDEINEREIADEFEAYQERSREADRP